MAADVRLELGGPVARLTLCRPPLNILTSAMLVELREGLEGAAADPATRVVRLDAEGQAFSAGVDVGDHVAERLAPMMEALLALFDALAAVPQPTVAVVQGAALGGGAELVLGTDLCFCAERATFGQPEIKLGVFAPPASVLLPRLIGERRELWLLLSGETIGSAEAERLGLVNAVFPDAELETRASERIARLTALSGAALVHAKRAVRTAGTLAPAEAQRRLHDQYLSELMATHDATEGLASFMAKRPPTWKHR
jgi:cyclohexa-1,5-dienecarbonyl-CoA hydratase